MRKYLQAQLKNMHRDSLGLIEQMPDSDFEIEFSTTFKHSPTFELAKLWNERLTKRPSKGKPRKVPLKPA